MSAGLPVADELAAARALLRQRQGDGARYDAAAAPANELRWARLGTAYFARQLNGLDDDGLWLPSVRPGWSRRRVIAAVGLEGRAMAQAIARATDGPSDECADVGSAALDLAETLPAAALRHLVAHSAVHLNVIWRDLSDPEWEVALEGEPWRTTRDTVLARARTLWQGALDLQAGGRPGDRPADYVAAMGG